ncbi:MAG: preprotein translocase subunit SecE [Pantoea sp. Brub]|nr:preprotein translocase subunit SecE [Pantoea sp. Brub]
MSANKENKKNLYNLEFIKWFIIAILLFIAVVGNHYYSSVNVYLRILVVITIIAISGGIALLTKKGKYVFNFAKEAKNEMRKVIWPTRQETFNTTLVIILVTIVTSLILWGLDSILVRIVSFITNLRF